MSDFLTTTIEMPLWLCILNTLILALVFRDDIKTTAELWDLKIERFTNEKT